MGKYSRGIHGIMEKWNIGSPKSKNERFRLDINAFTG